MPSGPDVLDPNLRGADLTILIPVWRRTHNIYRVLDSALAATPEAQVLFIASQDDDAALDLFGLAMFDHLVVPWAGGGRGDYARKINAGYRASTRPVLFTGADDIIFHPDWYPKARQRLDVPFQVLEKLGGGGLLIGSNRIPRIGVVGTNDLCNERTITGDHSTHSLVARWYADQGACVDQSAIIYHEGYWHEYCDDELVETAMVREAYVHAGGAIVEHAHPLAGKAPDDETYRRGRANSRLSKRLFLSRRRKWTPHGAPMRGRRRREVEQ